MITVIALTITNGLWHGIKVCPSYPFWFAGNRSKNRCYYCTASPLGSSAFRMLLYVLR
ncbi:hypothetical protein L873DRAFT_1822000 [Choiromyces venosus 120613-1]|uniref:Uncharacterized protein n=1 Tax=Choiromyces venosus 120613-1 TaxID=1336337 RepID=A0A3N4IVA8_9PEZI|nr:hypothetical protein L873DRAFT_1822000 [Choiromyces venosus 120613-1]